MIDAMDNNEFWRLYDAMVIMESQTMLANLKAARSPNMKQEDFDHLHKAVYMAAYPSMSREERVLLTPELLKGALHRG